MVMIKKHLLIRVCYIHHNLRKNGLQTGISGKSDNIQIDLSPKYAITNLVGDAFVFYSKVAQFVNGEMRIFE